MENNFSFNLTLNCFRIIIIIIWNRVQCTYLLLSVSFIHDIMFSMFFFFNKFLQKTKQNKNQKIMEKKWHHETRNENVFFI